MSWNDITKQIKMFIDAHPDTLFDIEITNHPPEREEEEKMIKVSMTAHIEVEEDDAHLKNLVDFEISNHPPEGEEGKELTKVGMTAPLPIALETPVDFEISNHHPEGEEGKELIKVKMTAHLELEEDDGLGKDYKKVHTTFWHNNQIN